VGLCDTQELKLYTATVLDCLGVKVDALTAAGTRLLAVRGAAHAYSLRRRHRRLAARVTAATYGAPPARQVCGVVLSGWCGDVLNAGLQGRTRESGLLPGFDTDGDDDDHAVVAADDDDAPPDSASEDALLPAGATPLAARVRLSLPPVEPHKLTVWCVQIAALEASHAVLADTVSEFSSVAAVLDRFGGWKRRFAATYKLAYAGESLFKVCIVQACGLLF
jgi:hypothetical protein